MKTAHPTLSAPAGSRGGAERVAQALLEGGPQSAASLSARLGLTGTAIRRHLDALEANGHVVVSDKAPYGPAAVHSVRRGRGRPARVYALTSAGRETFAQEYDELAVSALRFLADSGGEAAVRAFARSRASELQSRYAAVSTALDAPAALAVALTADGFAAEMVPGPLGDQLCQHHCPVGHVAAQFPQLCEAEAEAFSALLGTHVTRLATLAHGDGVCTTLVPHAPVVPGNPAAITSSSNALSSAVSGRDTP